MHPSKLIAAVVGIVVGVVMIPVLFSSIESANETTTTEDFTAAEDSSTEETFTLENDVLDGEDDNISSVEVNDSELDEADYSVGDSDNEVDLVADASDTDDDVSITYTYADELDGAVGTLVDLLPILFVVTIVAGAAAFIPQMRGNS